MIGPKWKILATPRAKHKNCKYTYPLTIKREILLLEITGKTTPNITQC